MTGPGRKLTTSVGRTRAALLRPLEPEARNRRFVHCSHHKAGTVWLFGILRAIAADYGWQVSQWPARATPGSKILLYEHARDFDAADVPGPFRGTHMVRDPRDIVVSAYHYHLWATEPWVLEPQERYGGRSYRQYLQDASPQEGLTIEIQRCSQTILRDMADWDYQRPEFLELRYEDVIAAEREQFDAVFDFFGLTAAARRRAGKVVDAHSFRRKTGRALGDAQEGSHLRSGAAGQWRDAFDHGHVELFKGVAGGLLVHLGYEDDLAW